MKTLEFLRNFLGNWCIQPDKEEEIKSADVVLTHEFGDLRNVSRTTHQIASVGAAIAKRYEKPLVCQFPGNLVVMKEEVTPAHVISRPILRPDAYFDTEEVQGQMANFCAVRGWEKVVLCCHPHHVWRASNNLIHHGLVPILPDVSGVMYDSTCTRFCLSRPLVYIPREIAARVLYFAKGLI